MNFKSVKSLIIIVILNLVALTGYYFLFQDIKTEAKSASALTNTIDQGEQKNSRLSALRANIKETEGERQKLSTFLLPSDSEVSFIEVVEKLASKSGLSVKTNDVSSVAGDSDATKIFKMQTQISGSWSNTMYFLSKLENLPYNIRVQNLSTSNQTTTGKGAASQWTTTFDVTVTESTT